MHKSTPFMIRKKLSSTHSLTVNISCLDGELLKDGEIRYTTYSKETSTMETLVDGTYGNGGGGRWYGLFSAWNESGDITKKYTETFCMS